MAATPRGPYGPQPSVFYLGASVGADRFVVNTLQVNDQIVQGAAAQNKDASFRDVSLRRLFANKSLPLSPANFDISQFGAGATITITSGSNGVRGQFAVANGIGASTNPNIIITVDDSPPAPSRLWPLFARNGGDSVLPHV